MKHAPKEHPEDSKTLKNIAKVISTFGRYYNDFEAIGTEHIPKQGPALVVFYHGLMPLDAWYFGLQYYLESGRSIRRFGEVDELQDPRPQVAGRNGWCRRRLPWGGTAHVGRRPSGGSFSGWYPRGHFWNGQQLPAFVERPHRIRNSRSMPKSISFQGFTRNVEELYRAPLADNSIFRISMNGPVGRSSRLWA